MTIIFYLVRSLLPLHDHRLATLIGTTPDENAGIEVVHAEVP